jgi:hypothetical protein
VLAGRRRNRERRYQAGLRTKKEVADQYGVTVKLVSAMIERGEIAVIGQYIHQDEAQRAFSGGRRSAA